MAGRGVSNLSPNVSELSCALSLGLQKVGGFKLELLPSPLLINWKYVTVNSIFDKFPCVKVMTQIDVLANYNLRKNSDWS